MRILVTKILRSSSDGEGTPRLIGQLKEADFGLKLKKINVNIGIGTTSPSAKLDVVGEAKISSDLTVSGTIFQAVTGSDAGDHVMDTYNDLHNLELYDYGRFAEMDAPIFADKTKTIVDTNKLKQLEHGALRQLLKRIEELEERVRQLQEASPHTNYVLRIRT